VHRDLKPENVILTEEGRVRVVDFGLARLADIEDAWSVADIADAETAFAPLETGIAGTPQYMAPEQWEASDTSAATDMWALGVMIFEMITGCKPFEGQDLVALARAVTKHAQPPSHPALSPPLSHWVSRCLSRDSSRRPSADELVDALRTLMSSPSLPVPPVSGPLAATVSMNEAPPANAWPSNAPPPVSAAPVPKSGAGWWLLVIAVIGAAGLAGGAWWVMQQRNRAPAEPSAGYDDERAPTAESPAPSAVTTPQPRAEASTSTEPPAPATQERPFARSSRAKPASKPEPPTKTTASPQGVPNEPPPAAGF
jgi:serine/threonine-protein kinase